MLPMVDPDGKPSTPDYRQARGPSYTSGGPLPRGILVVDDEENVRHMLHLMLEREGWSVAEAASGEEALAFLEDNHPNVVLCDLRMPGLDGRGVVAALRAKNHAPSVILMSAYGDRELAIEVIREGAYDFVAKPFEPDDLALTLRKAAEREHLRAENRTLRQALEAPTDHPDIITSSPELHQVLETASRVAVHKTTVLILGESGTGKELVARFVHENSDRAEGPLITVNCGAIPSQLLESELFGHARGAFTGAHKARQGLIAQAEGGSLLLDEVGELPQDLQVKLLRALQEDKIRAVGDDQERSVDVRFLAATSRDLAGMVSEGTFREDLYYRINVVSLEIPPLRDRSEDILPLARHFLTLHAVRLDLSALELGADAARTLLTYTWPGNVRELENAMERAVVLARDDTVQVADLPPVVQSVAQMRDSSSMDDDLALKPAMESLERRYMTAALRACEGNRSATARRLGISRRALLYKIERYGLLDVGIVRKNNEQ